jgi:hypothetical protein
MIDLYESNSAALRNIFSRQRCDDYWALKSPANMCLPAALKVQKKFDPHTKILADLTDQRAQGSRAASGNLAVVVLGLFPVVLCRPLKDCLEVLIDRLLGNVFGPLSLLFW